MRPIPDACGGCISLVYAWWCGAIYAICYLRYLRYLLPSAYSLLPTHLGVVDIGTLQVLDFIEVFYCGTS